MMTVAFVVGGVIAGTMVWQVWRFRESNPNVKANGIRREGRVGNIWHTQTGPNGSISA